MDPNVGAVVRDRRWGGRCTGTVVGRDGGWVFVAWHGSFVEDQLPVDEVEAWPDTPVELSRWRGGLGVLTAGGSERVEPVGGR